MQDDNIKRMAERALPQLTDVPVINILICDLINRLKRKITKNQLEHILVDNGIVSYFFFQESFAYLKESGSLKTEPICEYHSDNSEKKIDEKISLTEQGETCAKKLKNYISKTYRDKVTSCAISYFSMEQFEDQVRITYEKNNDGYYVHVRCLNKESDLMDLRFNVSSLEQAKFLGRKVMTNPSEFYAKVWNAFDTSPDLKNKDEIISE